QFTENKGIEDFLDAAVLAARSDPRCRFVLVGEVNEMDPFQVQLPAMIRRRQIDDRVHITGWMDDVAPVYAEMDVLVVPSRHEDPAPNTNIEAMACGVPIVATRVGGTPELVADGETAYLVDRLSPEQLAERILELAVDASARRRMGQAGRARAERLFDADRNAAAVERLLTGESAAHAVVREEA
ncbi:MAG: glycosyltransferase, partial [Rhodothermales bacterium]